MRKNSVNDILIGSPEQRSYLWSVFGLLDLCMFISVFRISIVSLPPLVLPSHVVWIAVVITYLIILDSVGQGFKGLS